ncbi:MAG: hypothetical protein WCH96_04630 [Betaproteobacteria bacterium]|jgi:hypothetical protein
MHLERQGVPTATFVTHAFDRYARGLCRMQAMQTLPIVVIAHPIAARPIAQLQDKVRGVKSDLIQALTTGPTPPQS